tara:strand:- start:1381 stop:1506 length:126 start_codon:yes stop_codon:yes gene_type:complete
MPNDGVAVNKEDGDSCKSNTAIDAILITTRRELSVTVMNVK